MTRPNILGERRGNGTSRCGKASIAKYLCPNGGRRSLTLHPLPFSLFLRAPLSAGRRKSVVIRTGLQSQYIPSFPNRVQRANSPPLFAQPPHPLGQLLSFNFFLFFLCFQSISIFWWHFLWVQQRGQPWPPRQSSCPQFNMVRNSISFFLFR